MPPSEIRKEAREALKGKWKKAVCITLAFLLVSIFIGFLQGLVEEGSILSSILDVVYFIINVPLSFGLLISFIKLKKGEDVKAFDYLKEGFSRFTTSWGICLHTFIRLLLPIICFVIITILHFVLLLANANVRLSAMLSLAYVVLLIATIIYMACRGLLYVISYNISYDNPELSSKECVKKSEELMKGNRGNYFMLQLSFIGWLILALLTLGIGSLWLLPYMQVATICFYERVINNQKTTKVEK